MAAVTVDTSCLIRFFTKDDQQKAQQVKQLLNSTQSIYIPEVVFPELEYVLCAHYQVTRLELQETFRFLLSLTNLKVNPQVITAIDIFEKTKLDMADCLITAYSESGKLASFDDQLIKVNKNGYWDK